MELINNIHNDIFDIHGQKKKKEKITLCIFLDIFFNANTHGFLHILPKLSSVLMTSASLTYRMYFGDVFSFVISGVIFRVVATYAYARPTPRTGFCLMTVPFSCHLGGGRVQFDPFFTPDPSSSHTSTVAIQSDSQIQQRHTLISISNSRRVAGEWEWREFPLQTSSPLGHSTVTLECSYLRSGPPLESCRLRWLSPSRFPIFFLSLFLNVLYSSSANIL